MKKVLLAVAFVVIALAIMFFVLQGKEAIAPTQNINVPTETIANDVPTVNSTPQSENTANNRVDFSAYGADIYRFSAHIPGDWEVEYVPGTEAINIFDPADEASSALEQSQIFIRYFEASDFLTLSTVDILSREATKISGHAAVRYEIEKKAGVANFSDQPSWRSVRHSLIDIRLAPSGKTLFYVFAYNPDLSRETFDAFISSLIFRDDTSSYLPNNSRVVWL